MNENARISRLNMRPVAFRPMEASYEAGALIPGPRNHILDAWVEVNSARVNQVVVGGTFNIGVQFEAENINGNTWHLAITGIDPTGAVACFWDESVGFPIQKSYVTDTRLLNKPSSPIMPAGTGALVVTLRLWLNDDFNVSPSAPPQNLWLNGISGQSPPPNTNGPFTA
ncbi:MAG: hypothetical protein PHI12_08545 [Dehalococcoidales bacterium]|nr:hypothetical protein [Dehalococcoidales bacterium]